MSQMSITLSACDMHAQSVILTFTNMKIGQQ